MNLEKLDEQEALRFSRELLSLYFEKRDMDTLAHHMEERTSWIGTGEGELCGNLAEAGAALLAELTEYEGTFTLMNQSLSFVPFTGLGGMVYGTICAIPDDQTLSDENVRFSAMLEQTEHGTKLVHIHFSHADLAQEHGDYFVKQTARADNQSLRAELNIRERQLANLTKNIPGGAHQCANDSSHCGQSRAAPLATLRSIGRSWAALLPASRKLSGRCKPEFAPGSFKFTISPSTAPLTVG